MNINGLPADYDRWKTWHPDEDATDDYWDDGEEYDDEEEVEEE